MGVRSFLRVDAGVAAARLPAHGRRAGQPHRAHREAALSRTPTIFAKGFEETALPDNFFDAVIGNIPFGNYPVHDPAYRHSPVTRTIHDYFLAKSLDKLRAGGVMALITSRYTMDKQDSTMRRYLADRADLVGAIRLPDTAFKANAGTEVTTDILFLQKRAPGNTPRGESWRDLAPIDDAGRRYFGKRVLRASSGDDAGRDAARRLDVPRPRADARGRTVAGAAATGRVVAAGRHLAARNGGRTAPARRRRTPACESRRHGCEGRGLCGPGRTARDPPGFGIRDGESTGLGGVAHPRHAGRAGCHPRRVPHAARRCAGGAHCRGAASAERHL